MLNTTDTSPKIKFFPINDHPLTNRYVVVDMSKGGMYGVDFEDSLLPDGHATKNLAVAAQAAHEFDMSFICVLQTSSNGVTLLKVCVAVTVQGAVRTPPAEFRPIHLMTRIDGVYEKVKYTTVPFELDTFIPMFEKLLSESPS